jgi:hypothetical protein
MKNTPHFHLSRLFQLDHQCYLKQVLLFAFFIFFSFTNINAQSKVWYEATTGSDSNSGSFNASLRGINKAISKMMEKIDFASVFKCLFIMNQIKAL